MFEPVVLLLDASQLRPLFFQLIDQVDDLVLADAELVVELDGLLLFLLVLDGEGLPLGAELGHLFLERVLELLLLLAHLLDELADLVVMDLKAFVLGAARVNLLPKCVHLVLVVFGDVFADLLLELLPLGPEALDLEGLFVVKGDRLLVGPLNGRKGSQVLGHPVDVPLPVGHHLALGLVLLP